MGTAECMRQNMYLLESAVTNAHLLSEGCASIIGQCNHLHQTARSLSYAAPLAKLVALGVQDFPRKRGSSVPGACTVRLGSSIQGNPCFCLGLEEGCEGRGVWADAGLR